MSNLLEIIMEQMKWIKGNQLYKLYYNNYKLKSRIMNYLSPIFILALIKLLSAQLVGNLSYQILSEGQQIELQLQRFFKYANLVQINEQRSTQNISQIFDIYMNDQPYQQVNTKVMSCKVNNKQIKLSATNYNATKSLYNQPVKLFLLQNNVLMIYIYKETSDASTDDNFVVCVNLTQNLTQAYRSKKIACSSMEVQAGSLQDLLYVACRADQTNKVYSFFLIQFTFELTQNGFINGIKKSNQYPLITKINYCLEYSLKYFDVIKMYFDVVPKYIFAFCKQKPMDSGNGSTAFYFFRPPQIFNTSFFQLNKCLTNSTYIAPNQNGFLSVINKRVYQYSTNPNNRESLCTPTDLVNISNKFAASRSYNGIDMTYFFLENNSIIIKSSYRTNHLRTDVNRKGFVFTSYALTEHFMALSMFNKTDTLLLIYNLDELYPRLLDEKIIPNIDGTFQNSVLMSTGNYLQQGYYVFFYDQAKNELSLNTYNGYTINIKPKEAQQLQMGNQQDVEKMYTIVIECHAQQLNQQLIINVNVRNFSNPEVVVLPIRPLTIDTPYVNFNLSAIAVGPLKRFYLDTNSTNKNLKLQFINYYSTINISHILELNDLPSKRNPQSVQKLKQIALNLQLKVMNPVFTMYYSTFIQNCALHYIREKAQFQMECHPQDVIRFTSSIHFDNTKVIVLTKDKWLQYSSEFLEFCSIVGESGVCELLDLDKIPIRQPIRKIKLVKFQSQINGYTYIEIFIICDNILQYGYFLRESSKKSTNFNYFKIFEVSSREVQQLKFMVLTNIHFDKNYNTFLLLHLAKTDEQGIDHKALLYDHPNNMKNKFLGHLIHVFDDEEIESIMTIDNIIVIVCILNDGSSAIDEYKVTQFFSVHKTRTYPLYGRKIVTNGSHVSDGEFLYIQAEIQQGQKEGKSEYLVYCPTLSTVNILTHVLPKQSLITFIQQIGSTKNRYPHSIGINGKNIFALSIPNLALRFDYDAHIKMQQQKLKGSSCNDPLITDIQSCLRQRQKSIQVGNLSLKLVDYKNIMHEIEYKYSFDISGEQIKYVHNQEQKPSLNEMSTNYSYELALDNVSGPVMSYDLNITNCSFVQKNIIFEDVFTKLQCLLPIDSKQFGTMLDITIMTLKNGLQIEILITTKYIICVSNKQIGSKIEMSRMSRACSITNDDNNKVLIICDDGQSTNIYLYSLFGESCVSYTLSQPIPKPSWLIYQYFKMRYQNPYVIFEVPIRMESNMIYFLSSFDISTKKFSDQFLSLTHNQIDHFLTKDFQVSLNYAFLLEDGLGIYELEDIQQLNLTTSQPLVWISKDKIGGALNSSAQIVYIQPQQQQGTLMQFNEERRCSSNFSSSMYLQIGTTSHAYRVKICFNDDDYMVKDQDDLTPQYQIFPLIIYKQYKDCKNDRLSKSKNWKGLTIKLCVLELQEYRIFSNYMPITAKSSEYYMQFYKIKQSHSPTQSIYPFRMEKVTTNDTFEIKQKQSELIVRSLFNFLCYYKLSDKVSWTLYRNPNYTQNTDPNLERYMCNITVTLRNENFNKEHNFFLYNTDPCPPQGYKPWIFRTFFIALSIVSLIKYRMYVQHKKNKINRLRNNIISNQFQFRVRLNSKKSIQIGLMSSSQIDP